MWVRIPLFTLKFILCSVGGIGRRDRLKICSLYKGVGSSPILSTKNITKFMTLKDMFKLKEYYDFKKTSFAKTIFNFFNKKWYFDRMYNQFIVQKTLKSSYSYFYQDIDRGLVEKFGPFGLSNVITKFSNEFKESQTGFILHYLAYFFVAILFFTALLSKDMVLFSLLLVIFIFYSTDNKV